MKTIQRVINYTFVKRYNSLSYWWIRVQTEGSINYSYSLGYENKSEIILLGLIVVEGELFEELDSFYKEESLRELTVVNVESHFDKVYEDKNIKFFILENGFWKKEFRKNLKGNNIAKLIENKSLAYKK